VKWKADGRIDFVSPIPCPFNYGRIDGVVSADGDPLDAIVLGPRLRSGTRISLQQRATVQFVDAGRDDPKVVLSAHPLSLVDRARIRAFFTAYVLAKRVLNRVRGKPAPTYVRAYEGV
jgi:inorganic pyrophosphatase